MQRFLSALSPLFGNSIFVEMPRQMPTIGGTTKFCLGANRYMEEEDVCQTEAARQANIAQQKCREMG